MPTDDPIALASWRRTVAEMYAAVRRAAAADAAGACQAFRAGRDVLFKTHPQSPLDPSARQAFTGLAYYRYDPGWRLTGRLETGVEPQTFSVELPTDGLLRLSRVARVHFVYQAARAFLNLYWIEGYGGGLFLPFLDATSAIETYGGGRYLYDTIKGADLGAAGDRLVLDFNYAYNPSCAYADRWACPLAPAENRVPFPVRAGEKAFARN